ncbi:recombinase family protein [Streptomyces luomodiensis]|uniref:Recombinase family protein n=1 Tax=Streptomyces luomodiensis TaxID=3026192 RepID=A0ABY9V752_9ACTN|nr:recombinase family protein [Streptomyces sp. SCA4-21]WNF00437.1 recombinase family protein [Streptomyces sp. SCA4-21]
MTTDEPKTLAFIYDREETSQTDRLLARIAICRAYAAEMNWDVAGQWIDRGDAATGERRPFWQGMVASMKQEDQGRRLVCLVAVWNRIAYEPVASARLRQLVSGVGGTCVAVEDGMSPSTPRDVVMRRLHESGEQIAPGTTLIRHDGMTA